MLSLTILDYMYHFNTSVSNFPTCPSFPSAFTNSGQDPTLSQELDKTTSLTLENDLINEIYSTKLCTCI